MHLPQVEQLELRDDLALLAQLVELTHEWPRVGEDVVAEVRGAHGEAARVGLGVENAQSILERVADRASRGELHNQRRALAQGPHRLLEPP